MSESQELIYAVETATVALERIAAALEVIAGAKSINSLQIANELVKDEEFLNPIHFTRCTYTGYACTSKAPEAQEDD